MRGKKAVVLVFAAFVLAVGLLAACGGAGDGGGGDGGGNVAFSGGTDAGGGGNGSTDANGGGGNGSTDASGGGNGGGMVTGTVSWPDGNPAANASVYFSISDSGFSGSGWSQQINDQGTWNGSWYYHVSQLPADGTYSMPGCPCDQLTAFLYVQATPGAPQGNGDRDCFIIMQDDHGNYSGVQVSPGDQLNWHVVDMNCSPTTYGTDPSSVQNQRVLSDPSANGGDYSEYSGTWQGAESRTSGGGSTS